LLAPGADAAVQRFPHRADDGISRATAGIRGSTARALLLRVSARRAGTPRRTALPEAFEGLLLRASARQRPTEAMAVRLSAAGMNLALEAAGRAARMARARRAATSSTARLLGPAVAARMAVLQRPTSHPEMLRRRAGITATPRVAARPASTMSVEPAAMAVAVVVGTNLIKATAAVLRARK